MRNIKLIIEYDGTNYCGWQIQRSKAEGRKQQTLQETIEKAIEKITAERVSIIASGRTDSGVHAAGQVANFKTNSNIPSEILLNAINSKLPDDIVAKAIKEAHPEFHSRFSAKEKTYRYTIYNCKTKPVLKRNFVCHVPYELDIAKLKKEARALVGSHDFKAFQASDKKKRTTRRNIKEIKIKKAGDFIYIDIRANSFLYNMVRNIVGTLIDAARGKLPDGCVKKILKSKDRKLAGRCAPARGLCLINVKY